MTGSYGGSHNWLQAGAQFKPRQDEQRVIEILEWLSLAPPIASWATADSMDLEGAYVNVASRARLPPRFKQRFVRLLPRGVDQCTGAEIARQLARSDDPLPPSTPMPPSTPAHLQREQRVGTYLAPKTKPIIHLAPVTYRPVTPETKPNFHETPIPSFPQFPRALGASQ